MKSFNNIYNKYKSQYSLISEGTIKHLIPLIQSDLLNGKSYNELSDLDKDKLQSDINNTLNSIKSTIESKVSNKQYQSWIYDVLKNKDQKYDEDLNDVINTILDFQSISKSSKLSKDQKNIQNYKSFKDLHKFVYDFKNSNTKYETVNFPLLYSNDKFNLYKIGIKEKQLFQSLYGPTGFKTAWCVADKSDDYFEHYLKRYKGFYILWTTKNNKPFASLHFGSGQFKDIHDNSIQSTEDVDILDGIIKLLKPAKYDISHLDGDLFNFIEPIERYTKDTKSPIELFLMLYPNISKFNKETNSIDIIGDFVGAELGSFIKDGKFTIKFGHCTGNFDCSGWDLISLEGCPNTVDETFECGANNFVDLKGAPQNVKEFICSLCDNLQSLEGAPQTVELFALRYCPNLKNLKGAPQNVTTLEVRCCGLTSLEGSPKSVVNFDCSGNKELTSLQGGPQKCYDYDCQRCSLTSLKGAPAELGFLLCNHNQISDWSYIPKVTVKMSISDNLNITDQLLERIKQNYAPDAYA